MKQTPLTNKKSLAERISEVKTKTSAPSLVPAGIEPKVKKEHIAEVLPDIKDVVADPRVRDALKPLIAQRAVLYFQERELKAAKKPIVEKVKQLLKQKASKFMVGENRVVLHYCIHRSVSADKLLALGVSPATIKAATEEKESLQLKVTPPSVDEVDDGEVD